jgi:hypothetical protein
MAKKLLNIGKLHAVKCEWCGLKMSCNCWDGNDRNPEGHIAVMCPRCQVTDFLNLIFGGQTRREILLSKVEPPRPTVKQHNSRKRPALRIIRR